MHPKALLVSMISLAAIPSTGCLLAAEDYEGDYDYGYTTPYVPPADRPPADGGGGGGGGGYVAFDPMGSDVTLEGSWAINFQDGDGDRAANTVNCQAAGIRNVQLSIYEDIGGAFVSPTAFLFPCSQGSFSASSVLRSGYYYYRWSALDAGGREIGSSDYFELDADGFSFVDSVKAVFEVEMLRQELASIELFWDMLSGPDYADGYCDEAGVVGGMAYELYGPWGELVASDDLDVCVDTLEFENLSYGEYELQVAGYESLADPTAYWQGVCIFFVDGDGGAEVDCEVYDDIF